MPITAAVIATAAIAAGKGVQSGVRARRAKKEIESLQKDLKEPTYELPQELVDAYNRQLGQRTDMPGRALAQYGLDLSYSNALGNASRAATSSQDLLSVATGLGEQKLRTSAAISALREKRYQESNNMFDAFGNVAGTLIGGFGGGGGGGGMTGAMPGVQANAAANAITNATSMQASQFGNYGNPAGGSGMGANWQGQIGGSFGGGYYDPNLQTWIPG